MVKQANIEVQADGRRERRKEEMRSQIFQVLRADGQLGKLLPTIRDHEIIVATPPATHVQDQSLFANRRNEVRAHIHAALNVGATRQEVAEVIFQQVTYGGMPVVVEALDVYAKVLGERGEPFPAEESAAR